MSALPAGAFLLGGCAATNVAPPVTPALVAASHGASGATLNTGREVFAGSCTACHSADPVAKHTVTEWRGIVDDMSPRAKLSVSERIALLAYLSAAHDSFRQ